MNVTLQQIADEVGVSKVTVSKVLRGKVKGAWPSSAERVRQIREVAQRLNYRGDWRAKALQSKQTNMIGLLSTRRPETRGYNHELLHGLNEGFHDAGYSLVFYRVPDDDEASNFADARFDGVVIDYHIELEELALLERSRLPAVIVNAPGIGGVESVMPDHIEAGRLAARHLIELGHRRIALLQPPAIDKVWWPQHMNRYWRRGVKAAMTAANLEDGLIEVVPPDDTYGRGSEVYLEVMRDLLCRPDRPTAIIANSPERAVENVLLHLDALGLKCPDDLSVFSMGDAQGLRWTRPTVSCLKLPFEQLGREAARALVRQLALAAEPTDGTAMASPHPPVKSFHELPLNIVARASTGTVPGRLRTC